MRQRREGRGRSAVRSGDSRFEKAARQRSRRARAHLERTQQRNRARVASPLRARLAVAACFAASLAIGLLVGGPAIERALSLHGGPRRVEWIDVLGNERLSAREVAEATGLEKGTPLNDFVPAELEARLARHDWIRSGRVVGLPNGAVVVRIDERDPVALLRGTPALRAEADAPPPATDGAAPASAEGATDPAGATATYLVDRHGVAFTRVASPAQVPEHPLLRLRMPRADAAAPDAPTLRTALELGRRLASAHALARLGDFEVWLPAAGDAAGWRVALTGDSADSALEIVLGQAPFDVQLDKLSQLLNRVPHEARAASSIDLRFAGQAVLRTRLASG